MAKKTAMQVAEEAKALAEAAKEIASRPTAALEARLAAVESQMAALEAKIAVIEAKQAAAEMKQAAAEMKQAAAEMKQAAAEAKAFVKPRAFDRDLARAELALTPEALDIPAPAVPAAPEAAPPAIGGGTIIRIADESVGAGTATIACLRATASGQPVISLLTAAHVVKRLLNAEVKAPGIGPIGKVTHVGGVVAGVPADVALIKITGPQPRRDIFAGNRKYAVRNFQRPVVENVDVVRHGGPHGGNGEVTGTVRVLDAGATTIIHNSLDGDKVITVPGLMKIEPTIFGGKFGHPGDSGAPVFIKVDDNTCDLVGVLVAVDEIGFGYAHHMANNPPGQLGIAEMMRVDALNAADA